MLVTLSKHVALTKIKIMETAVSHQMSYNAVGPITYKSSTYCTASNDSTDSKNTQVTVSDNPNCNTNPRLLKYVCNYAFFVNLLIWK